MAEEVYTVEEVRLLDDTDVELRPLSIAKMRKFSRIWGDHMIEMQKKFAENEKKAQEARDKGETPVEDFTEADLTDAQYTAFVKMCALGLESQVKGDKTDKQFIAYLEDVLDEHTIQRILKKTGGLELNNPNQNPAATATD